MKDAVAAFVVPFDSGFERRRMGKGAETLAASVLSAGLVPSRAVETYAGDRTFRGEVGSALHIQQWLSARVRDAVAAQRFPLVLAGNCSSAVGTCTGAGASISRLGVCWFDAHADFNTPETSETGFVDGMALAMLTGAAFASVTRQIDGFAAQDESLVAMFATRDIDDGERTRLERSRIDWPGRSGRGSDAESVARLAGQCDAVYLHVDLDTLDISEGRANQYACAGGFTRDHLIEVIASIRGRTRIAAAAITAYDPDFDADQRILMTALDVVRAITE